MAWNDIWNGNRKMKRSEWLGHLSECQAAAGRCTGHPRAGAAARPTGRLSGPRRMDFHGFLIGLHMFSWCFWFWCLKLCMLRMFDMFGVYFAQPVMNLRLATELWNWKIWNAGWWSEHSSQHCFSCSCCSTRCQQRIAEKREISLDLAVSNIYMIFMLKQHETHSFQDVSGSFSIRRSTSRRAFSDGEVLETFGGGAGRRIKSKERWQCS